MSVALDQPQALLQRAEAALQLRDLATAKAFVERAALAGAEANACSATCWLIAMLRGDFKAAWRESDRIRSRSGDDPHRLWTGESLEGKRIMLRCLHGFGDTVQMIRYAPAILQQATSLTVQVAPAMLQLAALFDGVDEVISWGDSAPVTEPAWDAQIEINELPYIFRTEALELPLRTKYLSLPSDLLSAVDTKTRRSDALRVGIVWTSGDWDNSRSIPFEHMQPLFATEGVEFWNLQGGDTRTAWDTLQGNHLHPASECSGSVTHLAAIIAQLDLVITTDTLAAHLAGALGTPAWVILSYAADWRWQHLRQDSPWYPSLRLFRQHWPGDWTGVLTDVRNRLQQAAYQHSAEPLVA